MLDSEIIQCDRWCQMVSVFILLYAKTKLLYMRAWNLYRFNFAIIHRTPSSPDAFMLCCEMVSEVEG